jgi:hypothetical protein
MRRNKQKYGYLVVLALGVIIGLSVNPGLIPSIGLASISTKPYYVTVDSVDDANFKTISIPTFVDTKGKTTEFTVINNQEKSTELVIDHIGVVLEDGTQIKMISVFETDSSYSDLVLEGKFVLMPHGQKSFKLGFYDFDYSQNPQFVISFKDGEEFIIPLKNNVNN